MAIKQSRNMIKLRACEEDIEAAHSFVADLLNRKDISNQIANETMIVFEALYQKLIDLELSSDTELEISGAKQLGDFTLRIGFEGRPLDLYADNENSIEGTILQSYDDKLAIAAGLFWSIPFDDLAGVQSEYGGTNFDRTFAEVITSAMPPSIFEPFETISPIPLMLVALLVTYAFCSAGRHFKSLRHAMEVCYTLFSRMLHVVMALLPVFCILAFLDVLLTDDDFWGLALILGYFVIIYASLLLLLMTYAIRLRMSGVHVIPFARKLIPLIRENFKIGSSIDAAPYNIRYCARVYGMNRDRLKRNLPMLAQINLDGNCFILMLIALMFVFLTEIKLSWFSFIILGALVLFLSLGAPNQPGSILIGTLIVTMYLQSFDVICAAIYLEAFVGSAQNIINVIGVVVAATIEERIVTNNQALVPTTTR